MNIQPDKTEQAFAACDRLKAKWRECGYGHHDDIFTELETIRQALSTALTRKGEGELLQEFADYIKECPEVVQEIDAGANYDGLCARTLIHFGETYESANAIIWGEENDAE